MKIRYSLFAAALAVLAACNDKKGADTESAVTADSQTDGTTAATAQQGGAPAVTCEPAEEGGIAVTFEDAIDLMLQDLNMDADGKAFYRGHPYNGAAWIGYDKTVAAKFVQGRVKEFGIYHTNGKKAATADVRGRLRDCYDTEGGTLTAEGFRERYPDLYGYASRVIGEF